MDGRFLNIESMSRQYGQIALTEQQRHPIGLKYDPMAVAIAVKNCLNTYGYSDVSITTGIRENPVIWAKNHKI